VHEDWVACANLISGSGDDGIRRVHQIGLDGAPLSRSAGATSSTGIAISGGPHIG